MISKESGFLEKLVVFQGLKPFSVTGNGLEIKTMSQ